MIEEKRSTEYPMYTQKYDYVFTKYSFLFGGALFGNRQTIGIYFQRDWFKSYTSFHMNGNNSLLVSQQTKRFFLLMFIIIYKKLVEAQNTMKMATANEREVIARCHRTQIIAERKTHITNILKLIRIF
jgi:hypothetical protein